MSLPEVPRAGWMELGWAPHIVGPPTMVQA